MGILDNIKRYLGLGIEEYEEYDDYEDAEEFEEVEDYREKETALIETPSSYENIDESTVFIYHAQMFDDVRFIKPVMKKNVTVIVDLTDIDDKDERRRFLDFAWGMAKAGGGRMKVLDTRELLFAVILPSGSWALVEEYSSSYTEPDTEEDESQ